MKPGNRFMQHVGRCLPAAVLLVAMATSVSAQGGDNPKKFLTGPLHIQDQGSFYIGGVPKTTFYASSPTPTGTQPNSIMIGQMYVQFQIPEGWNPKKMKEGVFPVIHVHGSTHSGAALEATPDGREGWLPYWVRHGIPTYVVDQAGRGRSGFDNSVFHEAEALLLAGDNVGAAQLIPSVGRITSNGSWTAWFGHLVQPGTATTCTDILNCELMPHGWRADDPSAPTVHPDPAGYGPAYPIDAIDVPEAPPNLAPLGPFADAHLGPTPFGPAERYQLKYYKQLVPNGEATLPGSICAACTTSNLSPANTWTPFDLALLVEKLGGAVVATHSQSGAMGHHMARLLRDRGHLSMLKGLVTIEGSCSLPGAGLTAADFDNVPYLALKGDYTVTSAVCQETVDAINARRAAGLGSAKADYIQLDDPSFNGAFNGTTHMMMLGTNHLAVADVILAWADNNITRYFKTMK